MKTEAETFNSSQWEVWSDPVENSKTLLPKFLILTTNGQEFVAEVRDARQAKLIAAAPELLKAAEWLLIQLHDDKGRQCRIYDDTLAPDSDDQTVVEFLRDIVTKAKGAE